MSKAEKYQTHTKRNIGDSSVGKTLLLTRYVKGIYEKNVMSLVDSEFQAINFVHNDKEIVQVKLLHTKNKTYTWNYT